MKRLLLTIAALMMLGTATWAQGEKWEGLARTPQMGWNTWNKFANRINEKLIRETADAMVSEGLLDAEHG